MNYCWGKLRDENFSESWDILQKAYHEAKNMWRQLEKIDRKSFLSQQHDTISLDMNEFWKVNQKLNKSKSNLDNCPLTADEIADGFESLQWENHDDIKNYIFSIENSLENKIGNKFKIEEVKWDGPNKRTSLRCALMSCKSASRGKSGINKRFLGNLSEQYIEIMLEMVNSSISLGNFYKFWKISRVTPVPKKGKNPRLISGYRPISVGDILGTCCEKIVAAQLQYFLEQNDLILTTNMDSGQTTRAVQLFYK